MNLSALCKPLANHIVPMLIYFIVGCQFSGSLPNANPLDDPSVHGVTNKGKDMSSADPKTRDMVNKILNSMNAEDSFISSKGSSGTCYLTRSLKRTDGIQFLIKESNTSIPLMLDRLSQMEIFPGEDGEYNDILHDILIAYFVVFREVKSVESIPILIKYVKKLQDDLQRYCSAICPLTFAVDAILHISKIGDGLTMYMVGREIPGKEFIRLAEEWYTERNRQANLGK